MSAALAAVTRGRRMAESLMFDACTIRKVTGHTTAPDGVVSPTYGSALYAGKCKIQNQRAAPSTPDAGEHQWTVTPTFIHLPVAGTDAIDTGQVLEITASVDPQNVGRKFRVKSGDRKSLQTAIRLIVDEVVN